MKYLITGGCGLLGSNLATELLRLNEEVIIFDNLSRQGTDKTLMHLKTLGEFRFVHGDVRNTNDVENIIKETKPDYIFHLAGQVAMTTSINNPRLDFEINVLGTINVLESIRKYSMNSAIFYSSTNKVYGDLENYTYIEGVTRYTCSQFPNGFDESVPLDFRSPYGCSKGSADQYILDFHRVYGLKTVVFRHSSIFGVNQFATFDQGWIGWFILKALETVKDPKTTFTISGDGKQVRDVLFARDLINCYITAAKSIDKISGNAFNMGGGLENSLSLLELFSILENKLQIKLNVTRLPWRLSDQKVFIANTEKAQKMFSWSTQTSVERGIEEMIAWSQQMKLI
jgi:CDP-paratose 2-epimerase